METTTKKRKRLTLSSLAPLVNRSVNSLRKDAQNGICPYIVASKPKGSKSYTYYINITELKRFEGEEVMNSFYAED